MEICQLTDRIHEIPIKHVRVFVIDDTPENGVTLVDTGFDDTADELVATLASEFDSIDRLYLTHDGPDHHGGVDAVVERFDPQVFAPAEETTLLESLTDEPDVTFGHGDVLEGNVEVVQIPGHTQATSALLLRDDGVLISGDTLDGADRRGLPSGHLLPPPETFNHDHAAAEANLERLLGYDFETVFVFHGSHVWEAAREKLDRYLNFKDHYRASVLEERS